MSFTILGKNNILEYVSLVVSFKLVWQNSVFCTYKIKERKKHRLFR